jgi:MFS family permease
VVGGFASYAIYSVHFQTTYGVFIQYVSADMGWSRATMAGVATVARACDALLGPVIGPILDRRGARQVMLVGSAFVGVGSLLLGTLNEIWQLYLYRGVILAIGGTLTSPLVIFVTVSNWFVAHRGRALGIVRLGDTVGTSVMPLVAAWLISMGGWRWAWVIMGIVAVMLLVPISRQMRRRPEDIGLLPDGVRPGEEVTSRSAAVRRRRAELMAADVVWSARAAVRTRALWALILVQGLSAMGVTSANLHLVPFIQELGYSIMVAAAAVGSRAYVGLIANPVWGVLIERVPIRPAAASQFLLAAVSMVMFTQATTEFSLGAALFTYGLASAGFYVVTDAMWASYFGRLSLGTVRGVGLPIAAALSAVGPLGMGVLYDVTGSYTLSWYVLAGAFALAALIALTTTRPRRPEPIPVPKEP